MRRYIVFTSLFLFIAISIPFAADLQDLHLKDDTGDVTCMAVREENVDGFEEIDILNLCS
jgi:hypothetical protein